MPSGKGAVNVTQPERLRRTTASLMGELGEAIQASPCIPNCPAQRSFSQRTGLMGEGLGLGLGLESDAPGASHPLLGITLFPSVLSLEPAGHGLSGGWGGLLLGTQTPDGHPVAGEQGEPSAGLDKGSKNKTGPPGMCSSLLLAAANLC